MPDAEKKGGGALALAAVFVGAVGFAACLVCVYRGMRDVMVSNGGYCASGGPYAINADQVCSSTDVWLLMGGIFAGLFFAAVLVGGTAAYSDDGIAGVSLLLWAALFGALGFNFIQLGFNPPDGVSGGTGWIVCGVLFWAMALGGLIPGLMFIAGNFRSPEQKAKDPSNFDAPLVRANVPFVRSMPGDPAYGMSDPSAADAASRGQSPAQQAPPREAQVDSGFVDPVTGETLGKEGDE
jgi:hypothetical protein